MAVSVKEVAMFKWLLDLADRLAKDMSGRKLSDCPRCGRLMASQIVYRGKIWFCHTCGFYRDYP